MPKMIVGLRERLICEGERQLMAGGYSGLHIRAVAKACKVATGTVYNYFPSKEMFVAAVLLTRWQQSMEQIRLSADTSPEAEPLLHTIYSQLMAFMEHYRVLFQDEAAIAVFSSALTQYHELLRMQLCQVIKPYCADEFEAEFVAEALLTWTVAGEDFAVIYRVIQKILIKER